jgi:hypothetical protein
MQEEANQFEEELKSSYTRILQSQQASVKKKKKNILMIRTVLFLGITRTINQKISTTNGRKTAAIFISKNSISKLAPNPSSHSSRKMEKNRVQFKRLCIKYFDSLSPFGCHSVFRCSQSLATAVQFK